LRTNLFKLEKIKWVSWGQRYASVTNYYVKKDEIKQTFLSNLFFLAIFSSFFDGRIYSFPW